MFSIVIIVDRRHAVMQFSLFNVEVKRYLFTYILHMYAYKAADNVQ